MLPKNKWPSGATFASFQRFGKDALTPSASKRVGKFLIDPSGNLRTGPFAVPSRSDQSTAGITNETSSGIS